MIELLAVLCGVSGLLLLLAALCQRRVRQAMAREHTRLTQHIEERERIARELHDQLLQSVTGLALHLHAAIRRMPSDSPQRESLQRVLARTNDTLVEARERACELRGGEFVEGALADALLALRHELSQQWPSLQIRVLVDGAPRRLTGLVREQAWCIGREAMINAARHAQSRSVEVEVHFAQHAFALIVRDDGRGIGPGAPDAARMEGRARRVGGVLHVRERNSCGTEVLLEVPADAAYAPAERRWWPFGSVRWR